MPRKIRNTSYYYGFPQFHMSDRLVFMNDLLNTDNNIKPVQAIKKNLYNTAQAQAAMVSQMISAAKDADAVKTAFEFLQNVTLNERNKELKIIEDYKDMLSKEFSAAEVNNFLNTSKLQSFNNPQALEDFYIQLTNFLTTVRLTREKTKQRLEKLMTNYGREMHELAQDDYRFRAAGDTQALLNNVLGIATRAQDKALATYSGKIRQLAMQYLNESGLLNRLTSGEDIAAAFAVVALDIQARMQEVLDALNLKDLTEIINDPALFENVVDRYMKADARYASHLQQAIKNNDMELQNILGAAKSILNIKKIEKEADQKSRKKLLEKRKYGLGKEKSLYKQLQDKVKENPAIQELDYIQFSVGASNTAHGNLFELIQVVQVGNTIKIVGPAGADTLHLGSLSFETSPVDLRPHFLPLMNEIGNTLTNYIQGERQDRFDERVQLETQMTQKLETYIEVLDKQAEKFDIDNLFVYHESEKLYKSAEVGQSNGFHGRDINIMTYLDKMYSANQLAGLSLPHRDMINYLAFNMSSLTVGGNLKGPLEEFFSIFAGLLMFDDVQLMAKEAAASLNNQTNGRTKQIHLYNLNGVYVPASMVLSFTYTSMQKIGDAAQNGLAAKATISTHEADKAIQDYLDTRPVPLSEQWAIVANQVQSGTNVRITVLSSFTNLIASLFNAI